MKTFLVILEERYVSATARTIPFNESLEDYDDEVDIYEKFEERDIDGDLVLGKYEANELEEAKKIAGEEWELSVDLLDGFELVV